MPNCDSASFSAAVPCISLRSASTTVFFAFGSLRFRNIATSHFQLLGVFYNGQSYQPTTRSHLSSRVVLGTCCSTKHYAIPRSADDERRRFRCSSQETPM